MDVRSAESDRVLTRAPRAPRRRPAPAEWVAATGAGAMAVALVLSPSSIEDGPVLCPFRLLTGLPCPGCGMTRAWVYLAHGWWRESFAAHPFGVVAVALLVALVVGVLLARWRGRPPPDLDRLVRQTWLRWVVAAWLAYAVVRLALVLV